MHLMAFKKTVNILIQTGILICFLSFFNCRKESKDPTNDLNIESQNTETSTGSMMPLIRDEIPYLDSLFTAAMLSAQNPTPDRISNTLTPIEGNPDLIDSIIDGERFVKMVSWSNNPFVYPERGLYNTDKHDIWVTVAPSIKDSCIKYYRTQKDPNMRLRQLLGLQPLSVETFFLEAWVKPADLFRPCPDNNTDDTSCDLNLPETVTEDYRKWFNDLRAVQYNDCNDSIFHQYGYPWTQLGYTYDWSPENKSHVGLSEFIIKRFSDIYIRGKYNNTTYCADEN